MSKASEYSLDPESRLGRIYDLVKEASCRRLLDLGSDHATVPIAVLKHKVCKSVLVTDIREGPLSSARRRASREKLSGNFEFVQTDGLSGLILLPDDLLLISGLGGDTIAGILDRGREQLALPRRIILQPQSKEEEVRDMMEELGLPISDEICLEDRGKVYLILVSDQGGKAPEMTPLERYLGPVILQKKAGARGLDRREEGPALESYLGKRIRRLHKQAAYDSRSNDLLLQWKLFEGSLGLPYNESDQELSQPDGCAAVSKGRQ